MKVAFISFECIPDTGFGGQGTYVWHAAHMLVRAGHHVEVACGTRNLSRTEYEEGILIHRIYTDEGAETFGHLASQVLSMRHVAIGGFDVVESPDANAEGAEFAFSHADVALAVRLHSPLYLIDKHNRPAINIASRLRFALGALRRGRLQVCPGDGQAAIRQRRREFEKLFILSADRLSAPSKALAQVIGEDWNVDSDRIVIFANPFEDSGTLSNIPLPRGGRGNNVLFIGRLERLKGVHQLGSAFAIVRHKFPNAKLRRLLSFGTPVFRSGSLLILDCQRARSTKMAASTTTARAWRAEIVFCAVRQFNCGSPAVGAPTR